MDTPHSIALPAQTGSSHVITGVFWLAASLAGLLLAGGCSSRHHIIGLKPDYPALPCVGYQGFCPPFSNRTPRVDSLRPTFRWERFPRIQDFSEVGLSPGETGQSERGMGLSDDMQWILGSGTNQVAKQVTDVSYELRLWKVGEDFSGDVEHPGTSGQWIGEADEYKYVWFHECRDTDPGKLVYHKLGLPSSEHTMETPLLPDSHYYWSIRVHFRYKGKRRATEWSELSGLWFAGLEFPHHHCLYPVTFHLFRTP